MKKCNKTMPKAKNGNNRGKCTRSFGHSAYCGNTTCPSCGCVLTLKTTYPSVVKDGSGCCKRCTNEKQRKYLGFNPQNFQKPGIEYTFRECGCTGILPNAIGASNKFAKQNSNIYKCRITGIIAECQIRARKYGYKPIDRNTPHSVIRKMMEEPNCERCEQPLKWEFGMGKTPHLHHNHDTGEIYGFTHCRCNPNALEIEVEKLKRENEELRKQIRLQGGNQTCAA